MNENPIDRLHQVYYECIDALIDVDDEERFAGLMAAIEELVGQP